MSYANGTQFYNLPQTVGTDKRDWFDTNSPFAAIDAALHSAVTGQASDAEAIATINGKLADDEADIAALQTKGNTHDSQIAALQTTVNTQASQIADVRQDAEDMITANNEGAAATSTRVYAIGDYFIYNDVLYKATAAIAVGDTIVPNTNCEATNVDTEISQINNDLADAKDAIAYMQANTFATPIDISSATTTGNAYQTHADGYVVINRSYQSPGSTSLRVNGLPMLTVNSDSTNSGLNSIYVRTGDKVYWEGTAPTTINFYAYVLTE